MLKKNFSYLQQRFKAAQFEHRNTLYRVEPTVLVWSEKFRDIKSRPTDHLKIEIVHNASLYLSHFVFCICFSKTVVEQRDCR